MFSFLKKKKFDLSSPDSFLRSFVTNLDNISSKDLVDIVKEASMKSNTGEYIAQIERAA